MHITSNSNQNYGIQLCFVDQNKENSNTANSPAELQAMPPECSFQLEQNDLRQSIILQDAQITQEARDKLSILLEKDFDHNVSKSSTDVGRTNLFQIDITTTGPPIAHKPYPIPIKCQIFIHEERQFLKDAGFIFKILSPWPPLVVTVHKTRPIKSSKTTALLSVKLPATHYIN